MSYNQLGQQSLFACETSKKTADITDLIRALFKTIFLLKIKIKKDVFSTISTCRFFPTKNTGISYWLGIPPRRHLYLLSLP